MFYLSSGNLSGADEVGRPIVKLLFVASCLLSIVSWYTTEQGMALYLSSWFALLASTGVQTALVLVAWLIGFSRAKRALLIAVYAITAVVSIGFSYVSLFTWFSARERPAQIERKLYDALADAADRTGQVVAGAIAEGQKHALALDEMTAAEKSHGFISRAQDSDPYLAGIREAVAREAQTYNTSYKEGAGEGLRYTAFDRYAKITRQTVERMQASQRALSDFRTQTKPLDPTEKQLRAFRQVYDAVPWSDVEQQLHSGKVARPEIPGYAEYVDRSVSGQEDLMIAFQELFTAPTGRHFFAFLLAAFIDVIVFLLAYASGPYFFGSPEQRWTRASAVIDSIDDQVFVRDFLRKLSAGPRGIARVDAAVLSPGERQFCLLLASKGLAAATEQEGTVYYLLDEAIHERLLESLATQRLPLRASTQRAQAQA
ncbi:MAG: hypothetical protein M1436_07130 [Acidobacteria bacterium]|nr:hypothetical protein [Acidobacteriota bacterium]